MVTRISSKLIVCCLVKYLCDNKLDLKWESGLLISRYSIMIAYETIPECLIRYLMTSPPVDSVYTLNVIVIMSSRVKRDILMTEPARDNTKHWYPTCNMINYPGPHTQ